MVDFIDVSMEDILFLGAILVVSRGGHLLPLCAATQ